MVRLLVTYMEQTAAPAGDPLLPPVPAAGVALERVDVETYLAAYRAIGEAVQWDSRLRMPRERLESWLAAHTSDTYLLRLSGAVVGLCELDSAERSDIELVHFGLVPAVQGQGLGKYLLDFAVRDCWSRRKPRRIWLHTDTNDHDNATRVYTSVGFRPYLRRMEDFED